MTIENHQDRQLSKNSIDLFILRFDLQPTKEEDYQAILTDLSKYFDRVEKRTQTNFEVNFTSDKSEVNKVEVFDHVLIKEQPAFSMTFSVSQHAFWFETKNYTDRRTYSQIITELIKSATAKQINLVAKRIGMRFINNFKCEKVKNVTKIFNAGISKSIVIRASQPFASRVICQEEFTYDFTVVRLNK